MMNLSEISHTHKGITFISFRLGDSLCDAPPVADTSSEKVLLASTAAINLEKETEMEKEMEMEKEKKEA